MKEILNDVKAVIIERIEGMKRDEFIDFLKVWSEVEKRLNKLKTDENGPIKGKNDEKR